MSNALRITGMATGMDTDTTVKQLMKPYQLKLDKMNQDKQVVQWKQELYRDIMTDLNSVKSTYFDVLKSDSNMLSKNNYAGFDAKAYDSGTINASSSVSVTAGTGSLSGNYKIDFTGGWLAAAAGVKSSGKVTTTGGSDALSSTKLSDLGIVNTTKITLGYDNGSGNVSKDIIITADMTINDLVSAINSNTSSSVTARYSELTGQLSIQTSSTGGNTKLGVTSSELGSNFLEKLKLGGPASTIVDETTDGYKIVPRDLSVLITPPMGSAIPVTKSSNKFTVDGITYNLSADKDSSSNPVKADVLITPNVQKTYDKIKAFIDKYNDLHDKINKKIEEKKQYSYLPLTDEQKKEMKEDDIKAWETKAKEGLLKNDSMLSNMLTSMRSAFYEGVQGAGITLSEVGLSTSSDISQRGKIIVDETKLKDAIQNRGEQVTNLFTKSSTSKPSYNPDLGAAERTIRSSEEGIFQRINDILQDYTRTTRNNAGKKGLLVEKAGVKGDFTEFNNLLYEDIKDKDDLINDMIKKMAAKENRYYAQFAKLEQAMNNMNSQSSWLSQQLGSMS